MQGLITEMEMQEMIYRLGEAQVCSQESRNFFGKLISKGLPEKLRPFLWMQSSGAQSYMTQYGQGYYQSLCEVDIDGVDN